MTNDVTMSILVKVGAEKEWTNEVEDSARATALSHVYNELLLLGVEYIDEDDWQKKNLDGAELTTMTQETDAASRAHGMCVTKTYWMNRIFDCLTKGDVPFTQRMVSVAATALAAAESRIRLGE